MENRKEYTFTKPAELDFIDGNLAFIVARYLFMPFGLGTPRAMESRGKASSKTLNRIGEALSFDAASLERLGTHSGRIDREITLFNVFSVVLFLALVGIIVAIYAGLKYLALEPFVSIIVGLVTSLITFYIATILTFRLADLVVGRNFAESDSVREIINLLADLSRNDVLIHPDRKNMIIVRICFLAKKTHMIGALYSNQSPSNARWLEKHFGAMARYLEERARWASAPTETTLSDLRNDLYNLAYIYINGNYGSFAWKDTGQEKAEEIPVDWQRRVLRTLPRFFGLLLPLILLAAYLLSPDSFPFLNLDKNVVSLVFFGWLLLALDTSLNLGIVSGVTKLAKEIKDLG